MTSSALNRIGHKDEAVARRFAEAVAIHRKICVCASCGIHLDDASPEQLQSIIELSEELLGKVMDM